MKFTLPFSSRKQDSWAKLIIYVNHLHLRVTGGKKPCRYCFILCLLYFRMGWTDSQRCVFL